MTLATTQPNTMQANQQDERASAIVPSRIPYPAFVHKAFGIDRGTWKALVEAIFPLAQSADSVVLALSYCRGRKLDVMKRPVHIVPIWSSTERQMVDTIWPGIGELRTTAFRTGEYAGRDPSDYGPEINRKIGTVEMSFPEWASVTVHRMVKFQRVAFAGPRVYWIETYATKKRDDDSPNQMWQDRPRGQIDKCAEAAALRAAFPEEVGSDYIPEEVQHASPISTQKTIEGSSLGTNALLEKLQANEPEPAPPADAGGSAPAAGTGSADESMTEDEKARILAEEAEAD